MGKNLGYAAWASIFVKEPWAVCGNEPQKTNEGQAQKNPTREKFLALSE